MIARFVTAFAVAVAALIPCAGWADDPAIPLPITAAAVTHRALDGSALAKRRVAFLWNGGPAH